jgi:hypothetical protein
VVLALFVAGDLLDGHAERFGQFGHGPAARDACTDEPAFSFPAGGPSEPTRRNAPAGVSVKVRLFSERPPPRSIP